MDLLSVIRRWRFRQKMPIREIERRTGLSRNTIRKYLRADTVEPQFKVSKRPSKLDPFAEKLSGWLRIEAGKSRKQKRTAKQMHADLVALGYEGSYGRVATFVRAWKANRQFEQQTSGRGTVDAFAVLAREVLLSSGSTPSSDEGNRLGLAYSEGVYEAGSEHLPDPFESESGGGFRADSPAGLENRSVPLSGIDLPPVPVGQEYLVFGPEQVEAWPAAPSDIEKMLPSLPRSTGLCRSTGDDPFRFWVHLHKKQKYCFMGFRRHPDLSSREGIEGPIEPVDLSRLELGQGNWRGFMRRSFSEVLGAGHPLMLPPHSSLAWYGRKLGWTETDVQSLSQFGSPAHPDSITVGGDPKKLINAFRMVALLRIDELVRLAPDHLLAEASEEGEERRREACEDLARWWLFILVARHRQDDFNHIYPGGFFHGVHGPDFVIDDNGQADFGVSANASHLILWSMEMRKKVEEAISAGTQDTLGAGNPYAGPRRLNL